MLRQPDCFTAYIFVTVKYGNTCAWLAPYTLFANLKQPPILAFSRKRGKGTGNVACLGSCSVGCAHETIISLYIRGRSPRYSPELATAIASMAYVSCVGCVLRTIDLRGAHGTPYLYPLKRPSESSDGLLKNG